jgi:hypothetical protein
MKIFYRYSNLQIKEQWVNVMSLIQWKNKFKTVNINNQLLI